MAASRSTKCCYAKFWHGVVMSSENSERLSDWYPPSQLIHTFILLLAALARVPPRAAVLRHEARGRLPSRPREHRLSDQPLITAKHHKLSGRHALYGAGLFSCEVVAHLAHFHRRRRSRGVVGYMTLVLARPVHPPLTSGTVREVAGQKPGSKRDAYPEHHNQHEPDEGHHRWIEGDAEAESSQIGIPVIADPEQDAPHHE